MGIGGVGGGGGGCGDRATAAAVVGLPGTGDGVGAAVAQSGDDQSGFAGEGFRVGREETTVGHGAGVWGEHVGVDSARRVPGQAA